MLTQEEFYNAANITMNPFRTNPTIEADPRKGIWVGYEKERDTLLKFLVRSRADQVGNINFLMIYGEYGTGKSHALLWSNYYITQQAKEIPEDPVHSSSPRVASKGDMVIFMV